MVDEGEETVEDLLQEIRFDRNDPTLSDGDILQEARGLFYERNPDRLKTPVSDLEILLARVWSLNPSGEAVPAGKRATLMNLMAADRFRRRVRHHVASGATEEEAKSRALEDEVAGRWLPGDWANERAMNPGLPEVPPEIPEPNEGESARVRVRRRIERSEEHWKEQMKPLLKPLRKTPPL